MGNYPAAGKMIIPKKAQQRRRRRMRQAEETYKKMGEGEPVRAHCGSSATRPSRPSGKSHPTTGAGRARNKPYREDEH